MRNGLDSDFTEKEVKGGKRLAKFGYALGIALALILVLWAAWPQLKERFFN